MRHKTVKVVLIRLDHIINPYPKFYAANIDIQYYTTIMKNTANTTIKHLPLPYIPPFQ